MDFSINLWLIVVGLLFGIGIKYATCASIGSITCIYSNPIKSISVVMGYGMGIFFGFHTRTNHLSIAQGKEVALYKLSDNYYIGIIIVVLISVIIVKLVKK